MQPHNHDCLLSLCSASVCDRLAPRREFLSVPRRPVWSIPSPAALDSSHESFRKDLELPRNHGFRLLDDLLILGPSKSTVAENLAFCSSHAKAGWTTRQLQEVNPRPGSRVGVFGLASRFSHRRVANSPLLPPRNGQASEIFSHHGAQNGLHFGANSFGNVCRPRHSGFHRPYGRIHPHSSTRRLELSAPGPFGTQTTSSTNKRPHASMARLPVFSTPRCFPTGVPTMVGGFGHEVGSRGTRFFLWGKSLAYKLKGNARRGERGDVSRPTVCEPPLGNPTSVVDTPRIEPPPSLPNTTSHVGFHTMVAPSLANAREARSSFENPPEVGALSGFTTVEIAAAASAPCLSAIIRSKLLEKSVSPSQISSHVASLQPSIKRYNAAFSRLFGMAFVRGYTLDSTMDQWAALILEMNKISSNQARNAFAALLWIPGFDDLKFHTLLKKVRQQWNHSAPRYGDFWDPMPVFLRLVQRPCDASIPSLRLRCKSRFTVCIVAFCK